MTQEKAPEPDISLAPPSPEDLFHAEKHFRLPEVGEQITSTRTKNTFTMGELIAEGSFGYVYHCTDVWGNDLAAKVLKPRGATYESIRAAAQTELERLVALRHPNITFVVEAFEHENTFYIVTERCHCSLGDLFRRPGFQGPVFFDGVARCILQAVDYVHQYTIAHNDIHSGNVLVFFAPDEVQRDAVGALQFKLADLGISKMFGEITPENTRAPWMLPPEVYDQAQFGPVDHRVDIYHLALLLLQVAMSQERQFTEGEIRSGEPQKLALGLPPKYSVPLAKALSPRVADRTGTPMELWRDLQAAARNSALAPPSPPKGP